MTFFNSNPWTSSGGSGGGGTTPQPLPPRTYVYEYSYVGTAVDQQLWKVTHPNLDVVNDKVLVYFNGILIDDPYWTYETINGDLYARIPFTPDPMAITAPHVNTVVITNARGN